MVYVMSRDQRVEDNHALIAAWLHAKANNLMLIVSFNIYTKVKNRTKQQYKWMFEGLENVEQKLRTLGIPFNLGFDTPFEQLVQFDKKFNPAAFYFDFSPLRGPVNLKERFARKSQTPCYVVDTHNIVPVWVASDHEEIGARTLRPKIHKVLDEYLEESTKLTKQNFVSLNTQKTENHGFSEILETMNLEHINNYHPVVKSGEDEAKKVLKDFIDNKLEDYSELRNDPSENHLSNLSAYLHFGQISTLRVALEINKAYGLTNRSDKWKESRKAFFEEMIIRKELSDNYCFYNKNYDNAKGAKQWAIKTLNDHKMDKREFIYYFEDLERAKTHDPAWNAAQNEMVKTGKMHGYMRMYWAKKVLEWTENTQAAHKYLIKLNDKYSLDGYDPNGYIGIMWSIYGVHDRGWGEREIFGKIRYMNYEGLRRKFDIESYIEKWL